MLKQMYTVFTVITLSSCGMEDKLNQAEKSKETETAATSVATAKEAPETLSMQSFAVTTNSALPTCSKERLGQLAYVRDEKTFYVCEDKWVVAEMPTKAGEKGDRGEKGEKGESIVGVAGRDGQDGINREIISAATWFDSEGREYIITKAVQKTKALTFCERGGYKLASAQMLENLVETTDFLYHHRSSNTSAHFHTYLEQAPTIWRLANAYDITPNQVGTFQMINQGSEGAYPVNEAHVVCYK